MSTLAEICNLQTDKISFDANLAGSYVSTENMVPGKGGITVPEIAPKGQKVTAFEPGDVLVSNIRPYFKKIWHADRPGCCSNDVLVFRASRCIPDFLYYVLSDDRFFDYSTKTAKGTKMPRGDKAAIMSYEVPPNSEKRQLAIASCLKPIDARIALNTRINDYLAAIIDALFKHEILNSFDNSWQKVSLLEIANYKNGLAMQNFRPEGTDPGLPVLKIKELGQGKCESDAERCRSDIDEKVRVHDGDLIFSWSGTLLLDFWAGGNAGLNQHLFKVTSDRYSPWFYYLWTNYHMRKFIALAKDRATTMGHIKRSALAESEVLIPPSARMAELQILFDPLVSQMISSKIESHKLEILRDVLLPKLMSGEIDVSRVDLTQLNNHLCEC